MAPIHDRMPVILRPHAYAQWIDPLPHNPPDLKGLLVPYPAEEMQAFPVSILVNSPANDLPEVVVPV